MKRKKKSEDIQDRLHFLINDLDYTIIVLETMQEKPPKDLHKILSIAEQRIHAGMTALRVPYISSAWKRKINSVIV